MSSVTCHTEGCMNSGVPIEAELTYRDEDGRVVQITNVICGVCSKPITDIKR